MAKAAGTYQRLWRPEEIDVRFARELSKPLTTGLEQLRSNPDRVRALNPSNGWGSYEGLVQFVEEYLLACKAHPSAEVSVSR
jgi:hypothetical protein